MRRYSKLVCPENIQYTHTTLVEFKVHRHSYYQVYTFGSKIKCAAI